MSLNPSQFTQPELPGMGDLPTGRAIQHATHPSFGGEEGYRKWRRGPNSAMRKADRAHGWSEDHNIVPHDIVPLASESAQDSYWSENIHPGAPAAREARGRANMDMDVASGPLKWPRTHSTEFVAPSSLATVQFEGVTPAHVAGMVGSTSTPPIRVEEHAGEDVVVDGNHRTAAALRGGRLFLEADVARPVMGPLRKVQTETSDGESWTGYESPGEALENNDDVRQRYLGGSS